MTHCLVYILQLTVFEFRNASCIFFFLFVCLVFVWGGFIFYILLFLSDWKVLYIHSKYQVCAEELWDTQRKKGTVTSPCCWAGPVRYKIQAPMWMNFGPETLPFFFFLTLSVCWSNGTTNRLRIQLKTHVPMTHTAIGPSIWLCAKCQIFAIFSFFSCFT